MLHVSWNLLPFQCCHLSRLTKVRAVNDICIAKIINSSKKCFSRAIYIFFFHYVPCTIYFEFPKEQIHGISFKTHFDIYFPSGTSFPLDLFNVNVSKKECFFLQKKIDLQKALFSFLLNCVVCLRIKIVNRFFSNSLVY